MAAYAALVSIMQILDQIEHHPSPPISMDKKQVESLTEIVIYLQEFLEGYKSPFVDGDEADPLEMRIADAVYAAEDVIESHIVGQILPAASAAELYESLVKMTEHMDLTKRNVIEIVAVVKDQLQRQVSPSIDSLAAANLYECVMKLIKHMDWIKKKVLDVSAVKYQLRRLLSASAYLYKSLMKVIQDIVLIDEKVEEIIANLRRREVSVSAGSTAYEYLYGGMMTLKEYMDSIEKKVGEIIANLQRLGVSESAGSTTKDKNKQMDLMEINANPRRLGVSEFDRSTTVARTKHMDFTKKEVMEIIALKDRLQKQVYPSADLYGDLVKVIKDMDLIKKEVMEHITVKDQLQRQISPHVGSSTSSLSRLNNITSIDDVVFQLMEKLIYGISDRQVIPIVGMGGIGKTTLATNVYEKPLTSHHFDIRAWVTISQQNDTKELLCEILSLAQKEEKDKLNKMTEDEIGLQVHKCLSYRRYLIVLDDIWSIEVWEKLQHYFPDNSNGSRIMVTTRLSNLGSRVKSNYLIQMKFMDERSSWDLLCKIVFGGESCPLELVKIGKKIVESCGGLPLSIVVIGGLLEKLERTKECWESIMGNINSLVNSEKDKYCLKLLKLSYNHLPIYLKPCFLYLGTFEEDCKIRVSTIIKLWVSEGILKPIKDKSLETVAKMYLDELVDRHLILVDEFGKTGNMKYLKIHDLLRDLCLVEAKKERFYHVVGQHSPQGMCSQRRVVILRSTSMEKVVDAMNTTPHARSYIRDHGRVQPLPTLKLLRILKAAPYTIHRYSVEKMLNLRLLDVSDGNRWLPSSINFLWSLQTLIGIHQQDPSNAPVEIWNISQLRHVCFRASAVVYGRGALHLPDPPSDDDNILVMANLQTLKGVMNFKCDEMMVRRIPNIKKLGLIGSLDDVDVSLHNIQHLQKLESLSCEYFCGSYVSNELTFPHSLTSLTLGFIGGRMEDILEKVSALPLLQKLKLSQGDFTTGKWETIDGRFPSLIYLSLAWCRQLECWMMESSSDFPCLEHLHLSNVKDLKEIPAELGEIPTLKSLTLNYCSESAVKSAKRMIEEQEESQGELSFKVVVWLSMENEELLSLANPNFQVSVGYARMVVRGAHASIS